MGFLNDSPMNSQNRKLILAILSQNRPLKTKRVKVASDDLASNPANNHLLLTELATCNEMAKLRFIRSVRRFEP